VKPTLEGTQGVLDARPPPPVSRTIADWRDDRGAARRGHGDADAVAALLAADVVLHSPMSATKVFSGRDAVTALHRDIFAVLEEVSTSAPLTLGDAGVFAFRARVRGVEIEAMNQVRVDEDGRILDYTIFVRPLPGLMTLFATLPPRVAARRHGRPAGLLVASIGRPLAVVHRAVDRLAPRLL
jgi:ketosteroid isomerase-like protein